MAKNGTEKVEIMKASKIKRTKIEREKERTKWTEIERKKERKKESVGDAEPCHPNNLY